MVFILLLFYIESHRANADVIKDQTSDLLAEFWGEIEMYRNLTNEPIPYSPSEDSDVLAYKKGLSTLQAGDANSAVQTFKDLVASNRTSEPLKDEVRATLGFIYLEQNRPKEALTEFSAIEKSDSLRERAWFGIAWSLLEQEEFAKSIVVLEDLVREYHDGEYTPEALSRIGYCYSRLLSYKNAVENYRMSLHILNARLAAQRTLLQSGNSSVILQKQFIFNNPNPEWRRVLSQLKKESEGNGILLAAEQFLDLEERAGRNFQSQSRPPSYRQSLEELRGRIQTSFQRLILARLSEKEKGLQGLSTDTAVDLARNLVLEESSIGTK